MKNVPFFILSFFFNMSLYGLELSEFKSANGLLVTCESAHCEEAGQATLAFIVGEAQKKFITLGASPDLFKDLSLLEIRFLKDIDRHAFFIPESGKERELPEQRSKRSKNHLLLFPFVSFPIQGEDQSLLFHELCHYWQELHAMPRDKWWREGLCYSLTEKAYPGSSKKHALRFKTISLANAGDLENREDIGFLFFKIFDQKIKTPFLVEIKKLFKNQEKADFQKSLSIMDISWPLIWQELHFKEEVLCPKGAELEYFCEEFIFNHPNTLDAWLEQKATSLFPQYRYVVTDKTIFDLRSIDFRKITGKLLYRRFLLVRDADKKNL
jgi:hypothetical protein